MGIFTRSDRPDAETLTARIAELEQRRDAIPAEIEAARGELSRAVATGADPKKHRATVAELDAEAAEIPGTIDALRAELVEIQAEIVAAKWDEKLKGHDAAAERLRKAADKLTAAIAEYDKAAGDPALLGGLGLFPQPPKVSAPNVKGYISSAAGKFRTDKQQAIAATRNRATREPSAVGEGLFFDESKGRYRPLSERPPREPKEPVTLDRKPGADENGDRIKKKAPGFYEARK